jgi:microcystin-dependent protein
LLVVRCFLSITSEIFMKKLLLLFIFNLALVFSSLGQAGVSSTNLSFQGIARDATNNALANQSNFPITVTLFYGSGTNEKTILTSSGTINTDVLGVFTYNMSIADTYFHKISNVEAWVRIAGNGVTFVQEQLRTVPYAVHAQNGVPTGAIMPFMGTVAPKGWLIADGRTFPNDIYHAKLRAIYSDGRTPDLRGMFLRGTGTNGTTSTYAGPTIRTVQAPDVLAHTHSVTISGTVNSNGSHSHDAKRNQGNNSNPRIASFQDPLESVATNTDSDNKYETITNTTGAHTHTIAGSGSASASGTNDTRPISYAVVYIIKI